MTDEIKLMCVRCGKNVIYNEHYCNFKLIKETYIINHKDYLCNSCQIELDWEWGNKQYSKKYRCINIDCNDVTDLEVTDGDDGYVELTCKHCNMSFRVNLPYDDSYDYELDEIIKNHDSKTCNKDGCIICNCL